MAQDLPWDFSKLDRILASIMSSTKKEILVGWPREKAKTHKPKKGQKQTIGLAELAAIHDLGLGHNPERPFLRQSVENRREQYVSLLAHELRIAYAGGQTLDRAWNRLGLVASKAIAAEVSSPDPAFQELSDARLAQRAKSKADPGKGQTPLWDTGQLVQSATWVVRKAGQTPGASGGRR